MLQKEGKSLLVIIPDYLSSLVEKGEVTDRYYNPGDIFEQVHILMTNEDTPDPQKVQKMVGTAKLHLHNVKLPPLGATLAWRPTLLKYWARPIVEKVRQIRPELIRCHANQINAYLASQVKQFLGVPYVLSLHINPDSDIRRLFRLKTSWKKRIYYRILRTIEREGLSHADVVVCVYQFIEPYARKYGSRDVRTIYNVINPSALVEKRDYQIGNPVRVIVVGRQFEHKDPTPLIQAVGRLQNVELTLIGTGELHQALKTTADRLGVRSQCQFIESISNDELCRKLARFDILVSVNDYGGVSKVELEAAQVGLPVITNRHPLEKLPEILNENCVVVGGSSDSYYQALLQLISDRSLRESLGQRLRHSVRELTPDKMERQWVQLYREKRKAYHD